MRDRWEIVIVVPSAATSVAQLGQSVLSLFSTPLYKRLHATMTKLSFLEFFAGGGMARLGLGSEWTCLLANDIDPKKAASYIANFGGAPELVVRDVKKISVRDISTKAGLAWASFPCQDLSLAGNGAGLSGDRSGVFWPFWRTIQDLSRVDRAPTVVALENVHGALTSNGGKDFTSICGALTETGFRVGALVMDASYFVPQSRPRLFIVGVSRDCDIPANLLLGGPDGFWHSDAIVAAYDRLPSAVQADWMWWRVPRPKSKPRSLRQILEAEPIGVEWNSPAKTKYLLSLMSALNTKKVETAQKLGRVAVGTIYRRTRVDSRGCRVQRAEVRFDDVAGCLRTPSGGSSRQTLMFVEGSRVRSRLLSPREAARLMGLPESYQLPLNYNDAYHLIGDGVVVPVVRHLARTLLLPLAQSSMADVLTAV